MDSPGVARHALQIGAGAEDEHAGVPEVDAFRHVALGSLPVGLFHKGLDRARGKRGKTTNIG